MIKRILIVFILCVVLTLPVYYISLIFEPFLPSSMLDFVITTIGYTVISIFASRYIVMHDTIKQKSLLFKVLIFCMTMLIYVFVSWNALFLLLYIIGFFVFIFTGVVMF